LQSHTLLGPRLLCDVKRRHWDFCRQEVEGLIAESLARVDRPPLPAGDPAAKKDDLAALLGALSAAYEASPQLWLDPELR